MPDVSDKLIKKLGALYIKEILAGSDKRKVRFSAFCISSINKILAGLRKLFFKKNANPQKILIYRTGSLGDSLCATPALSLIRNHYKQAHITLLSNTGKKSFVSPDKVIHKDLYDDIMDYMGMGTSELLRLLRQNKFDMVILLPHVDVSFKRMLRDMIFFRLVASAGWGWKVSRTLVYRKKIERYVFYPNEAHRLLALCQENDIKNGELVFRMNVENGDQEIADKYFHVNNLNGKSVMAIAVGANSVKNRWPIGYFAQVINHFRFTNPVLLIGGPEDKELVTQFDGLEGVYICCGKFTPMQSALIIRKCSLAITNDTGPLHLSYAVGTPLIGLFASRDFYGKWFPPEGSKHKVFRTPDVACSLCFFNQCDNNICMQAIRPADVIKAATELMS